jgi:acyl-CoA reductase-like NAD-dependent aldehyde dehydrogenase
VRAGAPHDNAPSRPIEDTAVGSMIPRGPDRIWRSLMRSVNPATGASIREYPAHSVSDVEIRLARAREAAIAWRALPIAARAARIGEIARALRAGVKDYARMMTEEMGKPITAAEAEVEKCAVLCDHVATHGPAYLAPETFATEASKSFVRYDPLGAVLAIMPWNFPFWQAFRCAAPALLAGNVVLLKHASNVPGCALAIESVFRDAGLPAGVFTTLLVPASAVGHLIAHPAIHAIALTGSELAGSEIAGRAGAALKKTVLELGGSDAFIVLADADPGRAAEAAAAGRTINSGQSCIAAKRFLVEAAVADAFEEAFVARMRALVVGDPMDRRTQVGPLARADLRDALQRQVEQTLAQGARLLLGGTSGTGPGYFYPPTVLTSVEPGMTAFDEETFGPVAVVVRARDERHAVELANQSRYGLGASVWTADPARGERMAESLEAGSVFVNENVKSDPRLPFGGVKRSGYGRELAQAGIREFVNIKTVWVR